MINLGSSGKPAFSVFRGPALPRSAFKKKWNVRAKINTFKHKVRMPLLKTIFSNKKCECPYKNQCFYAKTLKNQAKIKVRFKSAPKFQHKKQGSL